MKNWLALLAFVGVLGCDVNKRTSFGKSLDFQMECNELMGTYTEACKVTTKYGESCYFRFSRTAHTVPCSMFGLDP